MTQWIMQNLGPDVPLHFTAFHPDYKMMDKPSTPPKTLTQARVIAMKNGLRYVYTGNVHDFEGESTYCHKCKEILIGRDWYVLSTWNVSTDEHSGFCNKCGTRLPGYFDSPRGEMHITENIGARLNMRDFLDTMRSSGVDTGGGPAAFSQRDKQAFANELDRFLTKYPIGS